MESDQPNDQAAGAERLQAEIAALPGVRAVRVVATGGGRISEIHVVADGPKSAKQIVRDVQTVALAQLGLDLDYRVVSVVHFGDEAIPGPAAHRPQLVSITSTTEGGRASCRVTLEAQAGTASGEASGGASAAGRLRLAAAAAVDAVRALHPKLQADVVDAAIAEVGGHRAVVAVLVRLDEGSEQPFVGTALVTGDELDAVARAVLDAFTQMLPE